MPEIEHVEPLPVAGGWWPPIKTYIEEIDYAVENLDPQELLAETNVGGVLSGDLLAPGLNQAAVDEFIAARVNDSSSDTAAALREQFPGGGGGSGAGITFKNLAGTVLSGRSLVVIVDTANNAIDDILVSSGSDSSAPTAPGTPTATAGVGQIVLAWAASSDNVGVANYRLYRSDAPTTVLVTVTSLSYTDTTAVAGTPYTYQVAAADTTGNISPKSPASASATATAPGIVNTVLPVISGTTTEGQTLTTTSGGWTPTADSYGYQWKRAGTPISGATGTTYVLVTADVGNAITVTVTANKSGTSPASVTSAATATVIPVGGTALNNTVAPAISGSPTTGAVLTSTPGTWSATPDSHSYQWKRAGTNIAGATSNTYTLQVADEGQAITCAVTAVKTGYTSGTASSNTITPSGVPTGVAFVEDSFTEASGGGLAGHTGEAGATWTLNAATTTGSILLTNNRARHGNTSTTIYTASGTPADADYSVEADFVFLSLPTGASAGIFGRGSSSAAQYYGIRYSVTSGNWGLIRQPGATVMNSTAHVPTVGQTYHVKLTMLGTTITATISGGDLSSPIVITQTDSTLVTTGLAGINFSSASGSGASATVGIHIDNFRATD